MATSPLDPQTTPQGIAANLIASLRQCHVLAYMIGATVETIEAAPQDDGTVKLLFVMKDGTSFGIDIEPPGKRKLAVARHLNGLRRV